jgi:hypothetical protein
VLRGHFRRQQVLDGVFTVAPKIPQYTKAGLLEYIVELIVCEDEVSTKLFVNKLFHYQRFQAFQLVDKEPFRRLLKYLRPNLPDRDIPHRTKLKDSIMQRASLAMDTIKERLAVSYYVSIGCILLVKGRQHVDSQVSFTFDSWTSLAGDPFLSVTAHYIDAMDNNPQKWDLKTEQLAFTPIRGDHSGANIAKILVDTIDRFGIRAKVQFNSYISSPTHKIKVGWMTSDNATNNDTALKALGKVIDPKKARWDPVSRRIRFVTVSVLLQLVDYNSGVWSTHLTWLLVTLSKVFPQRQAIR